MLSNFSSGIFGPRQRSGKDQVVMISPHSVFAEINAVMKCLDRASSEDGLECLRHMLISVCLCVCVCVCRDCVSVLRVCVLSVL